MGKLEFVEVGKHDVESSFLKISKKILKTHLCHYPIPLYTANNVQFSKTKFNMILIYSHVIKNALE